LVDKPYITRM